MKLWKYIKRLWCKHPYYEHICTEYAKPKYKVLKKGSYTHHLRYDLWEERRCGCCGKKLGRGKVRSNLTQWDVEKRFGYCK
jgi:hypothetical protein